mmetsp:Transcript_32983/g.75980  ORF Transcript_32983/g.75980 Transcript_32983/m.75980 type:complete len:324 (-) Transcript_32983:405-1376(-)
MSETKSLRSSSLSPSAKDDPNGKQSSPSQNRLEKTKKRFTTLVVLVLFCIHQLLFAYIWQMESRRSCQQQQQQQQKASDSTRLYILKENMELPTPRAFPTWPENTPFPCADAEPDWWLTSVQRSPSKTGLLYVHEMKTGGSAVAGVVLRVAQQVGKRLGKRICKNRVDHTAAWRMEYSQRLRSASFLWTVLRDPTKRAVSQFFHFVVSREKAEPTDREARRYLMKPLWNNYYLRDLATREDDLSLTSLVDRSNRILNDYDFVGITERMDESLVALQMLLRLNVTDILYLSAKTRGGFDDGGYNNTCVYIVRIFSQECVKRLLL